MDFKSETIITNIRNMELAPKERMGNMENMENTFERTCHRTTPPRASDYMGAKQPKTSTVRSLSYL